MAVIKENVHESVAQRSLVRKEKKRSSRSELEIVKTQEKFGTKHQRPCALCEQSFSEVNLVLAVPFKVRPSKYSCTWYNSGIIDQGTVAKPRNIHCRESDAPKKESCCSG